MKGRFHLLVWLRPAAGGLVLVVLCGCATVMRSSYDCRPCYGAEPLHRVTVLWLSKPLVPPRPTGVPRAKPPPRVTHEQRLTVSRPAHVPRRQANREPTQDRPSTASHDYVENDRIVLPREYADGNGSAFTNEDLARLVVFYEEVYGVDRFLIAAVMRAESNFNRYAISPTGARGFMQLMPETARSLGVADSFDPAQNIAGGTLYLAKQIREFNELSLALAAYNAGPEAVRKHGGIPPYRETQDFVQRVTFYYQHYAGK